MRRLLMILSIAISVGTVSGAARASSSDNNCVISAFGVSNDTWGRVLWFQCSSGALCYDFISGGTSGTGGSDSVDNIKIYEARAAEAKLSEKITQITYNTPAHCSSLQFDHDRSIDPPDHNIARGGTLYAPTH
jgi:hypothetical protein